MDVQYPLADLHPSRTSLFILQVKLVILLMDEFLHFFLALVRGSPSNICNLSGLVSLLSSWDSDTMLIPQKSKKDKESKSFPVPEMYVQQ